MESEVSCRMGTVIVGLVVVMVVALVVRSMVRDKKNGKSLQCGGECKHCGSTVESKACKPLEV